MRDFVHGEHQFSQHPDFSESRLVPMTCPSFSVSLFSLLSSPALMPLPQHMAAYKMMPATTDW